MAAELTKVRGQVSLFSVKDTPWHREGHVLSDHPDFETAITKGGLDYPLEKRPYLLPVKGGGTTEAKDAFYVYRVDTEKVLGKVGSDYEIVSNLEAFEVLKPLVDEGVLKLETGGVLREGADAWLMGVWDLSRFGETAKEVLGEEVAPYATVMANHSGRRGVLVGSTPIRVVCANTLGMAEVNGQSRWAQVNHTRAAKSRLVEAAQQMFGNVVERYEVVAKQYRLLKECYLSNEQFQRLVLDIVSPDPRLHRDWNPEAKLAATVLDRALAKRRELTRLWREGKGHTGEPTAWFAYNSVTEALDHNRDLWPTRNGCYRTASLLTGELAEKKNLVLDGLVEFAMGA